MKVSLTALVIALAVALIAPVQAGAHYANPGAVDCGWVSYKKGTDWGAGSWARGTSCREARRLAWDYRDRRYGVYKRYQCRLRHRRMGHRGYWMVHSESRCVKRGSKGRVRVTLVHT